MAAKWLRLIWRVHFPHQSSWEGPWLIRRDDNHCHHSLAAPDSLRASHSFWWCLPMVMECSPPRCCGKDNGRPKRGWLQAGRQRWFWGCCHHLVKFESLIKLKPRILICSCIRWYYTLVWAIKLLWGLTFVIWPSGGEICLIQFTP